MSRGRSLQVGDEALTDYNGPGRYPTMTRVMIVERDDTRQRGASQSGILFRVRPNLRNGTDDSWYDADWFEPAPPNVVVQPPPKAVGCNVVLGAERPGKE